MDPTTFIAGVSGVLQAAQVWYAARNHQSARNAFDRGYTSARKSLAVQQEARAVAHLVPQPVFDALSERAHACWTKYLEVLEGGYLPSEIDEATEAVKKCVCRELKRIVQLGEPLPPGKLSDMWTQYCGK